MCIYVPTRPYRANNIAGELCRRTTQDHSQSGDELDRDGQGDGQEEQKSRQTDTLLPGGSAIPTTMPPVPTLREVTLEVNPGELVCVYGPTGCGKSSLLMSLLGEVRRVEGTVEVRERLHGYHPSFHNTWRAWYHPSRLYNDHLMLMSESKRGLLYFRPECCIFSTSLCASYVLSPLGLLSLRKRFWVLCVRLTFLSQAIRLCLCVFFFFFLLFLLFRPPGYCFEATFATTELVTTTGGER